MHFLIKWTISKTKIMIEENWKYRNVNNVGILFKLCMWVMVGTWIYGGCHGNRCMTPCHLWVASSLDSEACFWCQQLPYSSFSLLQTLAHTVSDCSDVSLDLLIRATFHSPSGLMIWGLWYGDYDVRTMMWVISMSPLCHQLSSPCATITAQCNKHHSLVKNVCPVG